jgi:hypothetical protein
MDPSLALDQLRQATDFHTKNQALGLYDLIDVEDYEDTRRLVRTPLPCEQTYSGEDGRWRGTALTIHSTIAVPNLDRPT